jgi:hypothetical protein
MTMPTDPYTFQRYPGPGDLPDRRPKPLDDDCIVCEECEAIVRKEEARHIHGTWYCVDHGDEIDLWDVGNDLVDDLDKQINFKVLPSKQILDQSVWGPIAQRGQWILWFPAADRKEAIDRGLISSII